MKPPIGPATALLVVLATSTSTTALERQDSAAGTWAGRIEPSDTDSIEVAVELHRAASGEWQGALLIPDWQPEAAQLQQISVEGDGVRFSSPDLPGAPSFVGRLSADGKRIEGEVAHDAPPPPPGSDIYLFDLEIHGDSWRLGDAVNITDRDGYDNQPRFWPDGRALLYTSIREGQADVYRYEIEGGQNVQVTTTEQSEYSPTPLPSAGGFSTVRVEDDGTQRLWRFDADGGQPSLILPDVQPVGYHGWLDRDRLALFVLGEPPTLVLAGDGRPAETVAESVGRSIHLTPDGAAVSFVHKLSESDWRIELLDLESRRRRTVIATRAGSEDFIWTPGGRILTGDGSGLYLCSPDDEAPGWSRIADLGHNGISGITRLAMSADSKHLAVVGERPAAEPTAERTTHAFTLVRSVEE